jgi:hypothetical protein
MRLKAFYLAVKPTLRSARFIMMVPYSILSAATGSEPT